MIGNVVEKKPSAIKPLSTSKLLLPKGGSTTRENPIIQPKSEPTKNEINIDSSASLGSSSSNPVATKVGDVEKDNLDLNGINIEEAIAEIQSLISQKNIDFLRQQSPQNISARNGPKAKRTQVVESRNSPAVPESDMKQKPLEASISSVDYFDLEGRKIVDFDEIAKAVFIEMVKIYPVLSEKEQEGIKLIHNILSKYQKNGLIIRKQDILQNEALDFNSICQVSRYKL